MEDADGGNLSATYTASFLMPVTLEVLKCALFTFNFPCVICCYQLPVIDGILTCRIQAQGGIVAKGAGGKK